MSAHQLPAGDSSLPSSSLHPALLLARAASAGWHARSAQWVRTCIPGTRFSFRGKICIFFLTKIPENRVARQAPSVLHCDGGPLLPHAAVALPRPRRGPFRAPRCPQHRPIAPKQHIPYTEYVRKQALVSYQYIPVYTGMSIYQWYVRGILSLGIGMQPERFCCRSRTASSCLSAAQEPPFIVFIFLPHRPAPAARFLPPSFLPSSGHDLPASTQPQTQPTGARTRK